MTKTFFGTLPGGMPIDLYTLTNANGVRVSITNYGGIVTSLLTPDRDGRLGDVVLGFDRLDGYLQDNVPYFGAIIGRYGNRIARGTFTLNGQTYTLAVNNGPNHLHGGTQGFDKVVWQAEEVADQVLKLTYTSPDGEEGYPGTLQVTVVYTLTPDNALKMEYWAQTDKATPVNLTNHSYFNLTAGKAPDVLNHTLLIDADRFVAVDATQIPTGALPSVAGTPMDFRSPHPIGVRIGQVEGGYDHTYVLNHAVRQLRRMARAIDPQSGRVLEVSTDQPGVQFYSGNFLDGSFTGKDGRPYRKHAGFCLETQHFPDSPNQPNFPSTILQPGDTYHTVTLYQFSVESR
ncbi:aldose 1-epimerase [Catalinimonas alkaloidigena]|uniref:Aldose 1-epimerase n=1 Tax=Catalinimonas alkaloidigena TaxID=1075417 RepID=A0A1G9A135_9BACT|nr:aldose epimerase family protein [Catalinimonas alkaloidigena]SDK20907.1 aldose 1-epimerase [Catalinimonas alkaloidigena]